MKNNNQDRREPDDFVFIKHSIEDGKCWMYLDSAGGHGDEKDESMSNNRYWWTLATALVADGQGKRLKEYIEKNCSGEVWGQVLTILEREQMNCTRDCSCKMDWWGPCLHAIEPLVNNYMSFLRGEDTAVAAAARPTTERLHYAVETVYWKGRGEESNAGLGLPDCMNGMYAKIQRYEKTFDTMEKDKLEREMETEAESDDDEATVEM
jgi:hypothetical protein